MRIELGIAIIAGAVSIVSAVISYRAQTDVASLNAKHQTGLEFMRTTLAQQPAMFAQQRERQKPFLERQMTYCFQATEVASEIANSENSPSRTKAIERFRQLYWGPLAVVEHPTVERAAVDFGNALRSKHLDRVMLQKLSLELAHACRDALQKLWGVDLGQLKNLRAAK
jgi:hypothetical protein